MPVQLSRAIMSYLIATGVAAATSISLANFTPRIENLPSRCQAVYTTPIKGCAPSDFPPRGVCSSECVAGLIGIMSAVEVACAKVEVPETSIIGLFLLGQGVQVLCPGIEVVTINPTSATPPPPAPTRSAQQPQETEQPEEPTETQQPSMTSTKEAESTPESTTTSSSGIAIDTTVPTTFVTTAAPSIPLPPQDSPTSLPPEPTTSVTSQKSNADSGGGSPFDIVATGTSASLIPMGTIFMCAIVATILLAFSAI